MGQEDKITAIYDMCIKMNGDIQAFKMQQEYHKQQIVENEVNIAKNKETIDTIIADRNKVIGVLWIGGSLGFFSGIGAFIMALIHHKTQ